MIEFEYANKNYYYEAGWILKLDSRFSDSIKFAEKICPVASHTDEAISSVPVEVARAILHGILHGYRFGYDSGQVDKAKEIRRALIIPEVY